MRFVVDRCEVLKIEPCVDLCGADVGVAEEFLDGLQVAAGLQDVAGEAVSQHVGVNGCRQTGGERSGANGI